MFYGKGRGKPGISQNSAGAKGDYEVRDLAQGETERHKFKCNLESDFKKAHGGVKGALGLLCLSVRQLC